MVPERLAAAAAAASSSSVPPPPTPRSINVQKFAESRAPEIRSLHDIVSARLDGDFRLRRDKRRRTTGHKSASKGPRHRSKRPKTGVREVPVQGGEDAVREDGAAVAGRKKLSRRARRRIEFQENPVSGFVKSGDGTRRLRTHLWHAKRFTMVKRWGFYLPLGLHGRGRGSRALLKRFKCGALIHDASYCIPIQLEGPEASVLSILNMVLMPSSPSSSNTLSNQVVHGVCYGSAMLCCGRNNPSKVIAPVIYMWQPFLIDNCNANGEQDTVPITSDSVSRDHRISLRKLLLWIHTAAFNEGLDVLNAACQKQMDGCGITVRCSTLEGQLAKMEVIGSKATELLKKILVPMSESCGVSDFSSSSNPCVVSHIKSDSKSFILQHAEQLPSRGIISLTVHDPRYLPFNETEFRSTDFSARPESDLQQEDASGSNILSSGMCADDAVLSLWSNSEINGIFLSESKDLWNCNNNKLYQPMPESILCKEKHHQRLKSLYLEPDDEELSRTNIDDVVRRYCPILLLKHGNQNICPGWSVILPLCWFKAFWNTLVSRGGHAIGLRERRWVACNSGLPSFPFDFPECKAYSSFMADEAAASDQMAKLRPLALRPFRVPIPPPWNCISSSIKKCCNLERRIRMMDEQSTVGADPQDVLMDLENVDSSFFPGFVARTSKSLAVYFQNSNIRKLLSMVESQRLEKGTLKRCETLVLTDNELCFTRILLHAFKEGVFEEGALVCAPLSEDLSQWTSRSEEVQEPEVLQVPESLVRSYFREQEPGRWELQIPEDCSINQNFRWPIGFVTTGSVYGSSKPVAVAYVEANLLAMLRRQQFQETQTTRPEIFLFIRNMRSTTYRRALATIVLEKQDDDLEFM